MKRLHEACTGSLLMSVTELHARLWPSFLVFEMLTRPVPHTSKQFFLTDRQIFVNCCQQLPFLIRPLLMWTGLLLISESELQGTVEEVENLRKEVDKLKHSGETDFCANSSVCDINIMVMVGVEF